MRINLFSDKPFFALKEIENTRHMGNLLREKAYDQQDRLKKFLTDNVVFGKIMCYTIMYDCIMISSRGEYYQMQKELTIQYIAVDRVRPNPYQPRKVFTQSALEELAHSIAEHGLMQPITVRIIGNSYELIAGERRLKASKLAGLTEIPAVIVEVTNKNSAVLALIENLQRENLNFLEESEAFQTIMQDYGYTQQELAKTLGKNQSTIANKLRILKLSPAIKKKLVEYNLTERHARALLKLPTEELQMEVLEKVGKQELNVKKTEQLIEQVLVNLTQEKVEEKKNNQKFRAFVRDIRLFTNTITQAVDMIQQSGIDAKYTMKQEDDGYEIRIKIPMNK